MHGAVRDDIGGSGSLSDGLTEHWAAVEADFARFYGIDLRTYIATEPARRVWALMRWLPPEVALWRSVAELAPEREAAEAAAVVRDAAITPAQFRAAFESGAIPR